MPYCDCCLVDVDDPSHTSSQKHKFNFLMFEWHLYKRALVRDRHGVEISVKILQHKHFNLDYNIKKGTYKLQITPQELIKNNHNVTFECVIKNNRIDNAVFLTSALTLHSVYAEHFVLQDPNDHLHEGRYLQIEPDFSYKVNIEFFGEWLPIGVFSVPIAFSLQTVDKKVFTIARCIEVSVGDPVVFETERGKSVFTNFDWPPNVTIHPPSQNQKYVNKYPIPREWEKVIRYGLTESNCRSPDDYSICMNLKRKMAPGISTVSNFQHYWHIVLWLEEMGQFLSLKHYNMEKITARILKNNLVEIEVPGLAEKRPSIIPTDMVELRIHDSTDAYTGIIKRVNDKTIEIAHLSEIFLQCIRNQPNIELDARFVLNRLHLERMHQGIDQLCTNGLVKNLFPTGKVCFRPNHANVLLNPEDYFNKDILDNMEQVRAVKNILNNSSGNAPYVVFGPPGTGKTVTLIEAILQLKVNTDYNILVCAPANAACDMLTEKLANYCNKKELIRILADSIDVSTVHQKVLDYSNYTIDGRFEKIPPRRLRDYRIIVTTLILIGRYSGKYRPDVVFIDEAAQASEPEVSCAISMSWGTRIILAGDPKQLGPCTSSKVAEKYLLGQSILERLMNLEPYEKMDQNFITMLKLNFRSHEMILKIPNALFYSNELKAVSERPNNDPVSSLSIHKSPNGKVKIQKGCAIEFYNVISKESRQGRSPSYYNIKEMEVVTNYVRAFLSDNASTKYNIFQTDIGIITPYVRQVYKIRENLKKNKFDQVEVGTTESFQGREKRIIIISTVRAQKDLLLYDKKFNLGFVRNEKRFNVAMTRAESKLIVVGCAVVLGTDSKLHTYIKECQKNNSFIGVPFVIRDAEFEEDVTRTFSKIKLKDDQYKRK